MIFVTACNTIGWSCTGYTMALCLPINRHVPHEYMWRVHMIALSCIPYCFLSTPTPHKTSCRVTRLYTWRACNTYVTCTSDEHTLDGYTESDENKPEDVLYSLSINRHQINNLSYCGVSLSFWTHSQSLSSCTEI